MTVKEANEKFNVSKDEIRKLCRESKEGPVIYIKATKSAIWNIDDNTEIIMTKSQITYSLLQLLKHKNNPNCITSHLTFPNDEISVIVFDYLCSLGYVGVREEKISTLNGCLDNIALTEDGLNALLNPIQTKRNKKIEQININFTNSLNVGLVNV